MATECEDKLDAAELTVRNLKTLHTKELAMKDKEIQNLKDKMSSPVKVTRQAKKTQREWVLYWSNKVPEQYRDLVKKVWEI